MKSIKNIIVKTIFVLSMIAIVLSFNSCKATKHVADDEYLLTKVSFDCDNSNIDFEDLKTTLKQKPNRKTLSVFRFHLMVYNMAKSGKERKFKEKIADVIGEPPVIYDEFATDRTTSNIESYLYAQSYYEADVKVVEKKKKKKISLTYQIKTREPYIISELNYDIIDPIIKELVLLDTINSLVRTNKNFNTDELQDERERLVRMLKSNGYYYFSINNIHYYADTTINQYQTKLTLAIRKSFDEKSIQNHSPFKAQVIRNIYIYADYDPKVTIDNIDTYNLTLDTIYIDGYNIIYSKKLDFKPSVLLQSCFVKRGDRYNIQNIEKTHAHFSNLRQFKLINIKLYPSEDVFLETQKERFLDLHIYLTPMLKQGYTLELEGNNTSGNIGMQGGISYNNKNLLRGAQLFRIKGSLAFQTLTLDAEDTRQTFFNTLEYGGDVSLNIPKLMIPFYENYEFVKNHNPNTRLNASFSYQQRPDYTRTIANVGFGYFWKGGKNNYLTHYINPIKLYLVKIFDFDPYFQEQIANLYIRYSYEDQLMSVISYDLLFNNQNINKLESFSYFRFNLETSGNIPNALYKLSGQEHVDGAFQFIGVEFAQFAKTDFDYRYYQIFNEKQSLVYRGFFGIGLPYGNSTKGLPFIKKYFIGGANDIRAWRVRSIGPGSYSNPESNYDQIADMKIMFNLEYRFKVISFIEGALFIDAGNIWAIDKNDNRAGALFRWDSFYEEIALGTGIGVRLDFSFFIIRFDFGVPLYDPAFPIYGPDSPLYNPDAPKTRWFRTFDTFEFSDFTFNFGIGYPF